MAITHHATIRNTLATAILTAVDQDVGAGALILNTSGDVEVATLALADPAGTVTGAVFTFDTTPAIEDTSATGGVVAKFVVTDNSGDEIFYGSVTATSGGGDIELSSVTIAATDTVQITSLTYTSAV